jgi:hypothetical protein
MLDSNARRSTLDCSRLRHSTRTLDDCNPATPLPFHHLARPLDGRQSNAGLTPMLDSNTPPLTLVCSRLRHSTRTLDDCNPATPLPFHHLARPLDGRQSNAGLTPMLDSNAPPLTLVCSRLRHSTQTLNTATPSPFHHLACPLDGRQSNTGSTPILGSNASHSTSDCLRLDTPTRDSNAWCCPVTF